MRASRIAACVILAASIAACGSAYPASIDFYRPGPGPNDVTLGVTVDSPTPPTRAIVVEQTETFIRVKAETSSSYGLDVRTRVEVQLTLDAPLGARTVLNEAGSAVLSETAPLS